MCIKIKESQLNQFRVDEMKYKVECTLNDIELELSAHLKIEASRKKTF